MSSLINRSGTWYLQWYDADGRQHKRSTKIKVAQDLQGKIAKQVQRDYDTRQAKSVAGIEDERLTVKEALSRHLASIRQTSAIYRADCASRAKRLAAWFEKHGVTLLEQIEPKHIDRLIEDRQSAGTANKTIKHDLDQLRATARLANRQRRVRPIMFDGWPTVARTTAVRPDRVGAYSVEDVARIIEYLGQGRQRIHWQIPVKLLAYLGCRWGELEALSVGDIDLQSDPPMVRIESHKTARNRKEQHRFVEIHPAILEDLVALVKDRGSEDRLISQLDKRNATKVMRRACLALGIRYRRLHGLRHFWISALLSAGVPLAVVMTMAGHRNLSTTQGYLHLDPRQTGYIRHLTTGSESGREFKTNKR